MAGRRFPIAYLYALPLSHGGYSQPWLEDDDGGVSALDDVVVGFWVVRPLHQSEDTEDCTYPLLIPCDSGDSHGNLI